MPCVWTKSKLDEATACGWPSSHKGRRREPGDTRPPTTRVTVTVTVRGVQTVRSPWQVGWSEMPRQSIKHNSYRPPASAARLKTESRFPTSRAGKAVMRLCACALSMRLPCFGFFPMPSSSLFSPLCHPSYIKKFPSLTRKNGQAGTLFVLRVNVLIFGSKVNLDTKRGRKQGMVSNQPSTKAWNCRHVESGWMLYRTCLIATPVSHSCPSSVIITPNLFLARNTPGAEAGSHPSTVIPAFRDDDR